jgi:hypothetical protein
MIISYSIRKKNGFHIWHTSFVIKVLNIKNASFLFSNPRNHPSQILTPNTTKWQNITFVIPHNINLINDENFLRTYIVIRSKA